jgi:hypothetical protein
MTPTWAIRNVGTRSIHFNPPSVLPPGRIDLPRSYRYSPSALAAMTGGFGRALCMDLMTQTQTTRNVVITYLHSSCVAV